MKQRTFKIELTVDEYDLIKGFLDTELDYYSKKSRKLAEEIIEKLITARY
jgi:hypothetical protein